MKYIILSLLYITPAIAMENYVPEDKGKTIWANKKHCEENTGKKCYGFDATVDDVEVMLVKDVELDDIEKPIYASRSDETDCKLYDRPEGDIEWKYPADDCRVITVKSCSGALQEQVCEYAMCTDKSYYSLYANKQDFNLGEGYFAYCTKKLGYEKKIEQMLVEDDTLKAAKLSAITASNLAAETKSVEDKTRAKELKGHIDELQTMIDAWDLATNAQRWDTVKAALKIQKKIIKQLLKDDKNVQ